MTLFAHMIIMDTETDTAMSLGRTYLTTDGAAGTPVRGRARLVVR